ncbi:MAG TPA: bidirectional hydrogenase complex protein HoxE [Promineifilum sp.]|nr:bidirectional hydrogenase complex protein HoxE [Promineifilum sp.]
MPLRNEKVDPPSDDKRWRIVQATMQRNGFERDGLIETLHTVQESFGFLDDDSLRYVAASLNAPLSQVYGVSTFYHLFSLKPAGQHTCVVCLGTACYIKGMPALLKQIERRYGIKAGETTPDGQFSLLTARCLGACGLAPVAVFDGSIAGRLEMDVAMSRLEEMTEVESVREA